MFFVIPWFFYKITLKISPRPVGHYTDNYTHMTLGWFGVGGFGKLKDNWRKLTIPTVKQHFLMCFLLLERVWRNL